MINAYLFEDLALDGTDNPADLTSVLQSLEWELMGLEAELRSDWETFSRRPFKTDIRFIMETQQQRLKVRCAIANQRKRK